MWLAVLLKPGNHSRGEFCEVIHGDCIEGLEHLVHDGLKLRGGKERLLAWGKGQREEEDEPLGTWCLRWYELLCVREMLADSAASVRSHSGWSSTQWRPFAEPLAPLLAFSSFDAGSWCNRWISEAQLPCSACIRKHHSAAGKLARVPGACHSPSWWHLDASVRPGCELPCVFPCSSGNCYSCSCHCLRHHLQMGKEVCPLECHALIPPTHTPTPPRDTCQCCEPRNWECGCSRNCCSGNGAATESASHSDWMVLPSCPPHHSCSPQPLSTVQASKTLTEWLQLRLFTKNAFSDFSCPKCPKVTGAYHLYAAIAIFGRSWDISPRIYCRIIRL